MTAGRWPGRVVTALESQYYEEANMALGIMTANELTSSRLHTRLRQLVVKSIENKEVPDAIPLDTIRLHLPNSFGAPDKAAKIEAPIENARIALLSFPGIPNYDLVGRNLMAHMMSHITIRMRPKALTLDLEKGEMQASMLVVRGKHRAVARICRALPFPDYSRCNRSAHPQIGFGAVQDSV